MEKTRDGFKSRTGFVIACIGSAVGMGNIWRFPYMVSDWGGMTFLIPYVLFVILIGASGVIEEMALGRAAKGGPIIAFGKCTEVRTGKNRRENRYYSGDWLSCPGNRLHGSSWLDFQIYFSCLVRTVSRHGTGYGCHRRYVWNHRNKIR